MPPCGACNLASACNGDAQFRVTEPKCGMRVFVQAIICAAEGDSERLPLSGAFRPTGDVRVLFTKFFCYDLLKAVEQASQPATRFRGNQLCDFTQRERLESLSQRVG